MKKNLFYFIFAVLTTWQAFGTQFFLTDKQKEVPTNEWGAVTYNTQISIGLNSTNKEFKTNQADEVLVLVRIKNLSTNEEYGLIVQIPFTTSEGMSFDVISPSGKKTSLVFHDPPPRLTGLAFFIHPNQIGGFGFELGEICKTDEVGTYEIIMKMKRGAPDRKTVFEIVSNPLFIKVVADK